MLTWPQVQDFARQKYLLRRDEVNEMVIAVPPAGTPDGKPAASAAPELLHAQTVVEFGEPWLLLRVAVCNERLLNTPAALQRSAQQVMGALVLADHLLALRHGMPLATLRQVDFERAVQFLARTAAYMRERLHAPQDPMLADAEADAIAPPCKLADSLFASWGD